jgi:hypothetical protein
MTWLLYQTVPNKQATAARELRRRGIEPYMLMAFPQTRINRHTKAKRPNPTIAPRFVGNYVALDLSPQQEWLLSQEDYMPTRVRPVPNVYGLRPVLSDVGVKFWTNPPRGLFRDVDVPRIRDAGRIPDLEEGDRVGLYSHGFQGLNGEVIKINGSMTQVRFKQGMFTTEVSVPAARLVRVA